MKRILLVVTAMLSFAGCMCPLSEQGYALLVQEKYGANLYCKLNTQQRTAFLKDEKGYDDRTIKDILLKTVTMGMTREQVLYSQGSPVHVNTTKTPWGNHEQWVYQVPHKYLYFDDGKLTGWQDID